MDPPTPITTFPDHAENPSGGDPLVNDLNAPYDKGDLCWLLICTVLCWLITPAIGFLYSGMSRKKSSLVMLVQSLFCASAVGLQFWLYGGSMYLTRTENPIIGDMSAAVFRNLLASPSFANADIPEILYAIYGCTFVTATAMILAGAVLDRGRLWPSMLFILSWTTFVYYFLAYWEWNPSGWLYKLGLYDYAGSGPVHIASGFGALAYSMMLGPRLGDDAIKGKYPPKFKPHSPFLIVLGTSLIWFGWFAFNGASTANLSLRSIYVVVNTNFAACGGGVTWVLLDYIFIKKFSLLGFCSGIISGLVGITAAAGFVPVFVAPLVGILTAVSCFFAARYQHLLRVDDGLDIFAIHGVGGVVGDLLTGLFAHKNIPALDGVQNALDGGWWDGNFRQLGLQLAGAMTCAAWSFVISCVLLFAINKIPGMHIRATAEDELRGLDYVYLEDALEDFAGGLIVSHGQAVDMSPRETSVSKSE